MKMPSPTSEPTNVKDPYAVIGSKASPTSATLKKIIHHHKIEKNIATAKAPIET